LPVSARLTADKNYGLGRLNPQHLLLRFKSMGEGFWSVQVGKHYRALGHREGDEITGGWIGSPADYDHLLAVLKKQTKT